MTSPEGAAPEPWSPLVSVIVPTHLPDPPYLGETLASVVAQDWGRWEVIVVDDGSPAPLRTLQELVAVDPRISLVRAPKGGPSRARNAGLGRAQGELVAFLDSDDYWYPGHLSGAVAALAGRPDAVGAYSVLAQVLGTEAEPFEVNRQSGPVDLLTALSGGNRPFINSLVARRRAVEEAGGFDPAFDGAEDKDLIYKLLAQGPCLYVDAPTVAYRVHSQNLSADIVQLCRADARVFAAHRARAVVAGDRGSGGCHRPRRGPGPALRRRRGRRPGCGGGEVRATEQRGRFVVVGAAPVPGAGLHQCRPGAPAPAA